MGDVGKENMDLWVGNRPKGRKQSTGCLGVGKALGGSGKDLHYVSQGLLRGPQVHLMTALGRAQKGNCKAPFQLLFENYLLGETSCDHTI